MENKNEIYNILKSNELDVVNNIMEVSLDLSREPTNEDIKQWLMDDFIDLVSHLFETDDTTTDWRADQDEYISYVKKFSERVYNKHFDTNESLAGQFYDIEAGMGLAQRGQTKQMKKMMKQMQKPSAFKKQNLSKMKKFDDFTSKEKTVTENAIWNVFVDTGEVPSTYLQVIAKKIKEGTELTNEQISIYKEYSTDIENLIKNVHKTD